MPKKFTGELKKLDGFRWEIPKTYMPGMRVPGLIYADETMIETIKREDSSQQIANAAHLPGVVRYSIAMPDIHYGYGLPIGGVLATDIDEQGVISPGGIGYDINCGVRLLKTNIRAAGETKRLRACIDLLCRTVPSGVGSQGAIRVETRTDKKVFREGAKWAVEKGYGTEEDLEFCEEKGAFKEADPGALSVRALKRAENQLGTLGSGNHFIELQVIDEIYDKEKAGIFGLEEGFLTVMIHTGSRGLGHQTCTDYTGRMQSALKKYGISIPDKQLACVPVRSPDGEAYLNAMRCAANYAWANRQVITDFVRRALSEAFASSEGSGSKLLYDVAHNIAKVEKYRIEGRERKLCVHRKGATRAFPPGSDQIPAKYRLTGQPVIIPGDMGRYSFLMAGVESGERAFFSTSHGAGRRLSRTAAKKAASGRNIENELAERGVYARCAARSTLNEEFPGAYKDVVSVVDIVEKAGLSVKVARMRPLGVIKG